MTIFMSEQQYSQDGVFNDETFYHSLKKLATHQML